MSTVKSPDPSRVSTLPSVKEYGGFWLWHIVPLVLLIVLPATPWVPFIHESFVHYERLPESLDSVFKDLCFVQSQCQIGMVGVWLIWGAGLWGKRFLLAIGLLALIYAPFLKAALLNPSLESLVPITIMVGVFYVVKPFTISVLVVGALSLLGWRITQELPVKIFKVTRQFSLRQLLLALLIAPAMMGSAVYVGAMYLADTRRGGVDGLIVVGGWNVMIAMPALLLLMGVILSGKSYLWRIGWVLLIAVILVTIGSGVLVSAEGKELFETRAIDSLCLLIGAQIVCYGISWCWLRKANLAFARTSLPKM